MNINQRGTLTLEERLDPNKDGQRGEVVMRETHNQGVKSYDVVTLQDSWCGLEKRNNGTLVVNRLNVNHMKNDLVSLWSGNTLVRRFTCLHDAAFKYSPRNHSDVWQAFSRSSRMNRLTPEIPVKNISINFAHCVVTGRKRNGFMFTEINEYSNIRLFENGIRYNTNSALPAFIDANNLINSVIGSPLYPIVPHYVSHKAIWIGDRKHGGVKSENTIIHCYDGQQVIRGKGADGVQVVQYPVGMPKEERIDLYKSLKNK